MKRTILTAALALGMAAAPVGAAQASDGYGNETIYLLCSASRGMEVYNTGYEAGARLLSPCQNSAQTLKWADVDRGRFTKADICWRAKRYGGSFGSSHNYNEEVVVGEHDIYVETGTVSYHPLTLERICDFSDHSGGG